LGTWVLGFSAPSGLKGCYDKADLHFIIIYCYRRLPLLKTVSAREVFVQELGRVREEMGLRPVTEGVPPDRRNTIHSLLLRTPMCTLRI